MIDGIAYFYRPENEDETREMVKCLHSAVIGRKLKIPSAFTNATESLMKLRGKSLEEALPVVKSDSTLQALCSSLYAGDHPTYDPSKVNEVDARAELTPEAFSGIRQQIKKFGAKPLKREPP